MEENERGDLGKEVDMLFLNHGIKDIQVGIETAWPQIRQGCNFRLKKEIENRF